MYNQVGATRPAHGRVRGDGDEKVAKGEKTKGT